MDLTLIIQKLVNSDWSDEEIATKLGMDIEEVFRFKQVSGLKEAFSNHKFSKSWIAFENKYYKKNSKS